MPSRSGIVLASVLRAFKPLARLLMRNGVAYPAFALVLKQVFLEAAVDELGATGKKQTDSAISLLSGVHRRDVRNLSRLDSSRIASEEPMNLVSEVAGRWLSDPDYLDDEGQPREIPRAGKKPSFEALVLAISNDVRSRAVLDELVRLGLAKETESGIRLLAPGFAPRQGLPEMAALLADNLHDHAAAASFNLDGTRNYLEQAVFCDELTLESVRQLHAAAARAWRQAFRVVMREAQARYDHDQTHACAEDRVHRVRFGTFFFASDDHDQPS
jgi:hypothetical protein